MSVVSFACLKGGVGKTSASVNVSHALAIRDCETLLIDLDPLQHASRMFEVSLNRPSVSCEILKKALSSDMQDLALQLRQSSKSARKNLSVLPGAEIFKEFGAAISGSAFRHFCHNLLHELAASYDFIVIDTPPFLNPAVKAALSSSDLVVAPIDTSVMSLDSLEELLGRFDQKNSPVFAILRTMLNRQASKVRALAEEQLNKRDLVRCDGSSRMEDMDLDGKSATELLAAITPGPEEQLAREHNAPVYLLDSVIYRTEQQNRLSFKHRTAFDLKDSAQLAGQYLTLAAEIEKVLSLSDESELAEPEIEMGQFLAIANLK
jgi:cellulose biosynthesis protein BcsQ